MLSAVSSIVLVVFQPSTHPAFESIYDPVETVVVDDVTYVLVNEDHIELGWVQAEIARVTNRRCEDLVEFRPEYYCADSAVLD